MARLLRYTSMAIDHWKKYRPKMYQELLKSGQLQKRAEQAAELTQDAMVEACHKGLSYDQAWEMIAPMWIRLPTEDDVPLLGEDSDCGAEASESGSRLDRSEN